MQAMLCIGICFEDLVSIDEENFYKKNVLRRDVIVCFVDISTQGRGVIHARFHQSHRTVSFEIGFEAIL